MADGVEICAIEWMFYSVTYLELLVEVLKSEDEKMRAEIRHD